MFEPLETLRTFGVDADRLDLASPLQLRRASPRAHDHLVLEFVDAVGRVVAGQWTPDPGRLAEIASRTRSRCPAAMTPIVDSGGHKLLLHLRGADRNLAHLRGIVEAPRCELISHRIGRRAVVRLADGDYAKVVRPKAFAECLSKSKAGLALANRRFRVPKIRRIDTDRHTIVWGRLAGSSLDTRLNDGDIDAAAAAGAVLADLHRAPAPNDWPRHGADSETRVLARWLARLAGFDAKLHAQLVDEMAEVERALAGTPMQAGVVHGDFHERQVIIGPDGCAALLDLDTLAIGEPALDVGNMLAEFDLRASQGRCDEVMLSRICDAFLGAYRPNAALLDRLPAYRAASRLRLKCVHAFRPPPATNDPSRESAHAFRPKGTTVELARYE